jgi:hypothetical protein
VVGTARTADDGINWARSGGLDNSERTREIARPRSRARKNELIEDTRAAVQQVYPADEATFIQRREAHVSTGQQRAAAGRALDRGRGLRDQPPRRVYQRHEPGPATPLPTNIGIA